jgi:hypothetical protein
LFSPLGNTLLFEAAAGPLTELPTSTLQDQKARMYFCMFTCAGEGLNLISACDEINSLECTFRGRRVTNCCLRTSISDASDELSLADIQTMLEDAVRQEDYKTAAFLRDELTWVSFLMLGNFSFLKNHCGVKLTWILHRNMCESAITADMNM